MLSVRLLLHPSFALVVAHGHGVSRPTARRVLTSFAVDYVLILIRDAPLDLEPTVHINVWVMQICTVHVVLLLLMLLKALRLHQV